MTATITIDKAGRCVLPKGVRERMHLKEGSCLHLELTGDTLKLTPVATAVVVEKIGKRRVIVGWEGFDAATAVNEARAEQVARLEAPFRQ
jgi:AbrB family looped-hinge helix DNA binding protein